MESKQFNAIISKIRKEATAKGGYILHGQINEIALIPPSLT